LAVSRTSLRSRGRPARPNIWRMTILVWFTRPSTGPELQFMVRPLVTASRSCSRPLANDAMPGRPTSRAAAIHCGRSWPVADRREPGQERDCRPDCAAGRPPGQPGPDRENLDVGDAVEGLSASTAHDLAAQGEAVAGLEHEPASAAGDGLGAVTNLVQGERHGH